MKDLATKAVALTAVGIISGVSANLPAAKAVDAFADTWARPGIYAELPPRNFKHAILYAGEALLDSSATAHAVFASSLPVPDPDLFYLQDALVDQHDSAWVRVMYSLVDDMTE